MRLKGPDRQATHFAFPEFPNLFTSSAGPGKERVYCKDYGRPQLEALNATVFH